MLVFSFADETKAYREQFAIAIEQV